MMVANNNVLRHNAAVMVANDNALVANASVTDAIDAALVADAAKSWRVNESEWAPPNTHEDEFSALDANINALRQNACAMHTNEDALAANASVTHASDAALDGINAKSSRESGLTSNHKRTQEQTPTWRARLCHAPLKTTVTLQPSLEETLKYIDTTSTKKVMQKRSAYSEAV